MSISFLRQLPRFLRNPVTIHEARATLRHRLEKRQADFLALAKQAVYGYSPSPYRLLLRLAGCEYGDLEHLVAKDGVEGALETLLRQGVYLSVDEFKGRKPMVRGRRTIAVRPECWRNRRTNAHVAALTGGSRGVGSPAPLALAFVREHAVNLALSLEARGGRDWRYATWAVPGGAGVLFSLLCAAATGRAPDRWFSPIDPDDAGLHSRYRWSTRLLGWMARVAGRVMPVPVHAPLDDPGNVASWVEGVLRGGGTPHVWTSSSAAVRLALTARAHGMDLSGAQFLLGMEPVTQERLAVIRSVGAVASPIFGSMDTGGPIGSGCLRPLEPDEVHLFHDLHAAIQAGPGPGPLPGGALLLSTLRLSSPLVLLNVSLGDHAVMSARRCGCPLEARGWSTHLHTIRSFEKLTAAGMTVLDVDVIRVLEEVLPARFGGGPTHYQLLEEDHDGGAALRLLVHPDVGDVDPNQVAEAFLAGIGRGAGAERVMSLAWRDAGLLRVERRAPLATTAGKILHLHVQPRSSAGASSGGG